MLGARLNFCFSVSAPGSSTAQSPAVKPIGEQQSQCSYRFPPQSSSLNTCSVKVKPLSGSRGQLRGRFCPKADLNGYHDVGDDYLEAAVMIVDSVKHYQLLLQGFPKDSSEYHLGPEFRVDLHSLKWNFLRRFQSPTIFLKIACDGDFVLPISVGGFALNRLLDSAVEEAPDVCANQYEFTRNVASEVGYQVTYVKITERVNDTYLGRIHFSKGGKNGEFHINARPSDAINVALRCKAPVYVNRKILMDDGIRMSCKISNLHEAEPCVDPVLDRPSTYQDVLAKELIVVKNLNRAIKEERYLEAAMWRDKLLALHESESES